MVKRASHGWQGKFLFLALTMLLVPGMASGEDTPILRGDWAATVGSSKTLRGRWIGQALPDEPDVMQGSWTLKDDGGRTLLTGTWTARKKGAGWQGSWSASVKDGRTAAGTWMADEPNARGKTLEELFIRTSKEQISGSWRSGRQEGYWWLKGSVSPGRSR